MHQRAIRSEGTHALRDRLRTVAISVLTLAMSWTLLGVAPAVAADPLKVVIIVGPTGGLTSMYKDIGNDIAAAALAAKPDAQVVKVYSPRATWSRVRNAVAGANVVVYLGHGNGYPSPYSTTEWTDRVNGWGLNKTTTGGSTEKNLVYCGEKALLGTLTSNDGATQWAKCGGKANLPGVHPAENFVMIYSNACYAPGAGEGGKPKATESVAFERVRNFSYPALKIGAGAYFATDMWHGAEQLVTNVLAHRSWTFGVIAEAANGYSLAAQRRMAHPDLSGRQVWIQRTTTTMGTDYWLAYAGNPSLTPSGAMGVYVPPPAPVVTAVSPASAALNVSATTKVTAKFSQPVTGVSTSSFRLRDVYGLTVPGGVAYSSSTRTATFTPAKPLEAGLTYRASLTKSIKSTLGVRLSRVSWSFGVQGPVSSSTTLFGQPQDLVLEPGTNTRYLFTRDGSMRGEKTATLATPATVSTTILRSLPNQSGRWFYVSDGTWSRYWLRESSAVHLADAGADASSDEQSFSSGDEVRVKLGTHTGYSFDAGKMTGYKTTTLPTGRLATASELRSLPGQTGLWFHMSSGAWKGRWLRASDVVFLY
jgi:hypothetical protein